MASGAFSPFEWMIAGRYLRARRKEGFISVIAGFSFAGIALGVATLIIVMSVMNGFRTELLERILGLNGHLLVRSTSTGGLPGYDEITQRLLAVDGVVRASPIIEGQVMASANDSATGVLVRGLRPTDLQSFNVIADNIIDGDLTTFEDDKGLAVGSRLASRLGLGVSDHLTLLAPRGAVTPFGTAPRVKAYPIAAIFSMGMSEYDSSFIFMPLGEAQRYFRMKNQVTAIEVMITDPDLVHDYRWPIIEAAGRGTRVVDWQQINSSFFGALQVERNVMFLILTLILIVAALNIISGLIMLVKDKGSDIAILRTMGATQGAIMRIFLISGASIGVVGTLVGLTLGTAFCANIETLRQWLSRLTGTELFSPEVYFLSRMPAEMDLGEVATVTLMALALSFLATLYPSWRAARLDPVEALRYE